MKQISDQDIENIKKMLRNRNSYLDIKEVLDNLEDIDSPHNSENQKSNSEASNFNSDSEEIAGFGRKGIPSKMGSKNEFSNPAHSENEDILKDEICKTCGFPKSWERNPVFIKDDIFSLMNAEENTCKECGHQADGYTIKKIQPLLKRYREAGIKDMLKDLRDLRNHHGKSSITNNDLDTIIKRYSN